VEEWPPPARLALLGLQYAVLDANYLVLVAIITAFWRRRSIPPRRR
jgi:hypothetical protein